MLAEKLKSEDSQLKDIARQLLAKVPKDNHKKSYTYDRYGGGVRVLSDGPSAGAFSTT